MGCTSSKQDESSTDVVATDKGSGSGSVNSDVQTRSLATTTVSSSSNGETNSSSNSNMSSSGRNPLSIKSSSSSLLRSRGLRVEVDSSGEGSSTSGGTGLSFSPSDRSPARSFHSGNGVISPPTSAHFTAGSSNNNSGGGGSATRRRSQSTGNSHWRNRGGHIPFGSEGAWSQKLQQHSSNTTTPSTNSLAAKSFGGTFNSTDEIQIDVTTTVGGGGSSSGASSSQPGLTQTISGGHWSEPGSAERTPEDGRSVDHSTGGSTNPHILPITSSSSTVGGGGGLLKPEILAGSSSLQTLGASVENLAGVGSPKSYSGGIRESPLANWLSSVDETASSGRRPSWAMRSLGSQNLDASMGDLETMSQTECFMADLHGSMSVRSERRNDAIRCISRGGGATWSTGGGGGGPGLPPLPEDMSTNAGNDMDEQEALLDIIPEDE